MIFTHPAQRFRSFSPARRISLAILFSVTLITVGIGWLTPRWYEATVKVGINPPRSGFPYPYPLNPDESADPAAFRQAFLEMVTCEAVAKKVLGLLQPDLKAVSREEVDFFLRQLKVDAPPGFSLNQSTVWYIRVRDLNPQRAARIANLLPMEAAALARQKEYQNLRRSLLFLEKQIERQGRRMEQAQKALSIMEKKSGLDPLWVSATRTESGGSAVLAAVVLEYLRTRWALRETEALLNQLHQSTEEGPLLPQMTRESPVLALLQDRIFHLESRLRALENQCPEPCPDRTSLIRELAAHRQQLSAELQREGQGKAQNRFRLQNRLRALRGILLNLYSLNDKRLLPFRQLAEYSGIEAGYRDLLRNLERLRFLEQALASGPEQVEILEKATPPIRPVRPTLLHYGLIGLGLGALLGAMGVWLLKTLDHTLHSAEEVERRFHIPVLGSIPRE